MKKIYLDELESISNELINYSQKNIADGIEELKLSTNNFIWQGPAYNSFINGYNLKIYELEKMNEELTKISKFLLSVTDSYSNTNLKISNAYEELLNEIKAMGK